LIHHASGLRDYLVLLMLAGGRRGDVITQKDALGLLRGQRELNFTPGEEHFYCNSNYVLLATILERVTKQSYHDWMAKNVASFDPQPMAMRVAEIYLAGRMTSPSGKDAEATPDEPKAVKIDPARLEGSFRGRERLLPP
jgi:CubicO group peptidase (beta-lactamase class C family)